MMKKNTVAYLVAVCFSVLLCACGAGNNVEVFDLKTENLINPLGLGTNQPRLSWKLQSRERGVIQEAYRIIVASTEDKLNNDNGDLWDSGIIHSRETILIPYQGRPLTSRETCFWKVKVWTNKGEAASVGKASWTMGLLDPSDWKADWIGLEKDEGAQPHDETRLNARYLRKEIALNKNVRQAVLYLSGLGLYEAYLNGNRIGAQVLAPTPTDYSKRVPYNTFDVTGCVNKGKNTIGVVLGNGRFFSMRKQWIRTFGFPCLLSQLEVTYEDGATEIFTSDASWKITDDGPTGANNEFDGEEYDARKEMPGWHSNGFDDKDWQAVEPVKAPAGRLYAQENPNIKVMETITPIAIRKIAGNKYIVDMGQNMVGWIKLKVNGKKGDRVTLRYAELLKEDDNLYMDNLRGAKVTDIYTLKGGGVETWRPSFVYHGFRYVEVTGFPDVPMLEAFAGEVIYDEMETTGDFETSNETINQIYKNAYWGIRGNYRGMPTDCPQRDERMGWLGDRAAGAHGESFIFDNHKLYAKWLDDIEDAQRENGALPDVAPNYWEMYTNDVTWPAAYFIIADMLYRQYGDSRPVISHYDSFKRFLAYIRDNYMKDYIVTADTYGDWCMPPESPEMIHSQDPARKTSGALLSTAFYYRLAVLMQQFATRAGHEEDTVYYSQLANNIAAAFNKKFYNNAAKNYSNNTATANLLAIMHNLAPDSLKQDVFNHIADKTEREFNGHVSTGLIGVQWLMRGLSDYGRADLAYRIATNKTYPSWGYMIEKGATTIWELWNGDTANPAMNSANHVMLLGDLIIWYYEYLAGIKNAKDGIAFDKIEMKPLTVNGLNYVNASYNSARGKIKSHWQKLEDKFIWDITIPANCTATVYLPDAAGKKITESGIAIEKVTGVKNIRTLDDQIVLEIGSGSYAFEVNCPAQNPSNYISFGNQSESYRYFAYKNDGSVLVSGHRGGREKGFPENSVEGLQHILQQMPAIFEIDPRLTKDSVIVLMHDATLDRTTTGSGKLADYTWAELQSVRLKDHEGNITDFKIPTLEEVIIWSKGKTVVNLDKKDVPFHRIVDLIKKHRAEKHVMITVHTGAQARYYSDRLPGIMLSVFARDAKEYEDIRISGVPWHTMIAYVGHTINKSNQSIVDKLHENGVRCMVSYAPTHDRLQTKAEREKAYREDMKCQPDIVESDIPTEIWAILAK